MLDDLKFIAQGDKNDALGVVEKQTGQLRHNFNVSFSPKEEIRNVVVAGMGGSALAAGMVVSWPSPTAPFVVSRQYNIPAFVNEHTLFVASSYSGNTEETVEALGKAIERGAQIAVIASGGQLEQVAKEKEFAFIQLPGGLQPRMAVWYNFRALLELLEAAGVVKDAVTELGRAVPFLDEAALRWRADVKTADNLAKQIAEEVMGKTPVIYGGPLLSPAAYKWKINFNENAKNVAFYNQFPEFNHNEFIGWTSHPVEKPFAPIELISSFEHERVLKRFEISNRLLSGMMPHPLEVRAEGTTPLEQLLWTVMLGDFVSVYLALLNKVDPTPVDMIEKLKDELKT